MEERKAVISIIDDGEKISHKLDSKGFGFVELIGHLVIISIKLVIDRQKEQADD